MTSTPLKTSGLLLRIIMPQNRGELERFMVEEWNAIPDDVLRNLAKEMRKRCEAIIEKNGKQISF